MKIILAIIRADTADAVSDALVAHDYHVTRVSSTGGFLRRGNTTLVCGVDEGQVDGALQVIRKACQTTPEEEVHRATIFVLNAVQSMQI